ncbi:MAG: hypothetical protein KIT58_05135 [Planctomycetota bacterium]|nr:hypothetical protein [Planctomycetota bacterium]
MGRLNPRGAASVGVALLFVLVGCWRFYWDVQGDLHRDDPAYWAALAASPLRYVTRCPSDGTFWGDLNTQWFKVLSVPCAMSLVYLWFRRRYGTLREGGWRFGQTWVRALWVGTFFVAFTLMEVEKEFRVLGNMAPMLAGERFWLNHLAHVLSAFLAWHLVARLSFEPVLAGDAAGRPAPPVGPR